MALAALHDCLFYLDTLAGFVSVSLSEAQEKVLIARKAYEQLPEQIRRMVPLVKASESELWFGDVARPSRLVSLPATSALRGRTMTLLVLDEIDFYRDAGADAFRVLVGRIARGGRGVIGSTCFGQDTVLDQVCTRGASHGEGETAAIKKASKFCIGRIPWWAGENEQTRASAEIAASELTPDQFAEEYECERGSAGDSFPVEMLRAAEHGDGEWIVTRDGRLLVPVFADGEQEEGTRPVPEATEIVIGYDVGQSRNPSVASILAASDGVWKQRAVYAPTDDRGRILGLPAQTEWLSAVLERFPLAVLVIDASGIGAGSAEALEERFPGRVLAMHASGLQAGQRRRASVTVSTDRYTMAVELKRALEARECQLVGDREQVKQCQRTRLLPGHRIDQPGSRRRSHYDRFWALVYGWWGVRQGGRRSVYSGRGLLVVGGSSAARGELRRSAGQVEQLRFIAGLVRGFLNGRPIPWETLTPEEAGHMDAVLLARMKRASANGDAVDLAAAAAERRRGAAVRDEEAARGR